jgi:hypothetical protein
MAAVRLNPSGKVGLALHPGVDAQGLAAEANGLGDVLGAGMVASGGQKFRDMPHWRQAGNAQP